MKEKGYVYLIRSGDWLKIGYTNDLNRRLAEYLQHNPEASLITYARNATPENEKAVIGLLQTLPYEEVYNKEWFKFKDVDNVLPDIVSWIQAIEEGNIHLLNWERIEDISLWIPYVADKLKNKPDEYKDLLRQIAKKSFSLGSLYYSYLRNQRVVQKLSKISETLTKRDHFFSLLNKTRKFPNLISSSNIKPDEDDLRLLEFLLIINRLFGKEKPDKELMCRILGFATYYHPSHFYPGFPEEIP